MPRKFRRTTTKACLKVTLPKKAEAKPKQIKVNIGTGKATDKTLEAKALSKAA